MTNQIDQIRKFYRGIWYPILVAALVLTGNLTGWDVPLACTVALTMIPGLFIMHDSEFLAAPFVMLAFTVTPRYFDHTTVNYGYSRYLEKPWPVVVGIVGGAVLVSLVWFIVRNRRGANHVGKSHVLFSLLILCGVMLFNGAFNPRYTPKDLLYAAVFAASLVLVYLFFALYGNFDHASADRFLFTLTVTGVLILAELAGAYLFGEVIRNGNIIKERVILGWGVWTSAGGMLVFLMPAPFYFARWHRRGWIFYLLGLAAFAGTLFSQSRGALLIGGVMLVICSAAVCTGGPNRRRNRIFTFVLAAVAAAALVVFRQRLGILIENFAELGFSDNGRLDLWRAGWDHFRAYPVFGSGFYDSYAGEWNFSGYPYFYHNTLVQFLGACGAAGLLAYLWHRVVTVRLAFTHRNVTKTFLAFCALGLLLCSLIDVLFFKTYPTVIYALILLHMEMTERKERD